MTPIAYGKYASVYTGGGRALSSGTCSGRLHRWTGRSQRRKKATATCFHHEFFSLMQYFPLCGWFCAKFSSYRFNKSMMVGETYKTHTKKRCKSPACVRHVRPVDRHFAGGWYIQGVRNEICCITFVWA